MSLRIAVTGASGRLGQRTVVQLLEAGYDVRAIDRVRPPSSPCPHHTTDIRDFGQVCGALYGSDAVLHLAALPSPGEHPQEEVFAINALGVFNVLEAASILGIRRVVYASSVAALGVAYATQPVSLRYIPLDEEHPLQPQDTYGLSKLVGEEVCQAFHRRTGGTAISLRFPKIWDSQAAPDLLHEMAADERRSLRTLWSYVEIDDAARACRLGLEATGLGAETFYLSAPRTFGHLPSAVLARRFFPDIAEIRGDEHGHWSFYDTRRAERLLNWTPEHDARL